MTFLILADVLPQRVPMQLLNHNQSSENHTANKENGAQSILDTSLDDSVCVTTLIFSSKTPRAEPGVAVTDQGAEFKYLISTQRSCLHPPHSFLHQWVFYCELSVPGGLFLCLTTTTESWSRRTMCLTNTLLCNLA